MFLTQKFKNEETTGSNIKGVGELHVAPWLLYSNLKCIQHSGVDSWVTFQPEYCLQEVCMLTFMRDFTSMLKNPIGNKIDYNARGDVGAIQIKYKRKKKKR